MFRPVTPAVYKTYNLNLIEYVRPVPGSPGEYYATYLTGTAASVAVQLVQAHVAAFIESSSGAQTSVWETAQYGCQTYIAGDHESFVAPPSKFEISHVKLGISNDEFYARSRAGEIVVSDYVRASVQVRQTPGLITSEPRFSDVAITFRNALKFGAISREQNRNGSMQYHIPGTNFFFSVGDDDTFFTYRQENFDKYEWRFHPPLSASSVISSLQAFNPESKSLVTNVLAKANRSSVDVLTAFAEMPKTIGSLLTGFKLVATILKDAKKGQFDLNKAHALRTKKLTDAYKKRQSRLLAEISNSKTSASRRKALLKHQEESRIKYRDTVASSAKELADELANLWLNYRYNIMPNVYLAQDVFDAVTKFSNEFITARGTRRGTESVQLGPFRINVDYTLRCMIKRSFSSSALSKGQGVISNDIFVTAWELVPLSFVYDWFINIGDLLSAQMYSNKWAQEGATKSVRVDVNLFFPFEDNINWSIEPTTQVDGFSYKRQVINPIDECGLVWQPSVGLERKIDAVALIWRPVRSLLLKGK